MGMSKKVKSSEKKDIRRCLFYCLNLEAAEGIEPPYSDLQSGT